MEGYWEGRQRDREGGEMGEMKGRDQTGDVTEKARRCASSRGAS